MNSKGKLFLSLIFIGALARLSPALAGTDPAAFLNRGVGARAMGMGGAFISLSNDPTAIYWNPAGLGKINRISVAAMMQSAGSGQWESLKDITPSYQFVGVTFPVNTFKLPGINNTSNTFGIGMISNRLGGVPYTYLDAAGVIVRDSFDDAENAYYFSYGFPLFQERDNVYAGATLKYITQQFSKIEGASASGYDVDFGLLYNYATLNFGLLIERGAVLTWANGHTDTGPLTTKFGISNEFALKPSL
ncbi:MAG: PorV/PorQ family protein [Endomicrobiales bacterium]